MAEIVRIPVTSSHLDEVGFDPDTGTLEVAFVGGEVYQVTGVTADLFQRLLRAPSPGRFFHQYIRPLGPVRIE